MHIYGLMDIKKVHVVTYCILYKAFDTIDHNIQIYILHKVGLSEYAVSWFRNDLSSRS